MSIRSLRSTYAILATVLVATALAAPRLAAQEPERPVLTAGGDPKLWEPYFDQGVKLFSHGPVSAERNFYWASKLDPTRAEPLYARYAAILARSKETDIIGYFRHDAVTWRRPEIIAADSLRMLAFMRSPFVHRGLEALIFERFPGAYPDDLDTRAWIAYSNGDFQKAIELQTSASPRTFATISGVTVPGGGAKGTSGNSTRPAKTWLQPAIASGFAPAARFFM